MCGAGEGNRTLIKSLGSFRSTIELHPLSDLLNSVLNGLTATIPVAVFQPCPIVVNAWATPQAPPLEYIASTSRAKCSKTFARLIFRVGVISPSSTVQGFIER